MKITRHEIQEEYSVTADWLKDFARKLEKKSYSIENLTNIRQMNETSKKFATIEEKMADIKQRIGFDNIKKLHEDDGLQDKTAAHDCGCGGSDPHACACDIKTASEKKHSEDDLRLMKNILNYIQDMCQHEHENLTPAMVISRCREETGLHFDDLPINLDKLTSFIEKCLNQHSSSQQEEVKYTPKDDLNDIEHNAEAEYWSHAFPQK